MIAPLLLAVTFAVSPQAAAMQSTSSIAVRRSNVVGDLATVLVSNGTVEGARVEVPVLVGRYSFGWQPLDILTDPCLLARRRIAAKTIDALLREMPSMTGACAVGSGPSSDIGGRRDVEEIRCHMRGPFVPYVIVSGSFAMGEWYGAGGGETFFRRVNSSWRTISGGGGALGSVDLRRLGVPQSAICAFHTYDAKCPK